MKLNFSEDIKDGFYTGIIAGAIATYFYGLNKTVQIKNYLTMPTALYIGLSTAVGTTASQILVDADEPLLAASVSGLCTVIANELVDSPVPALAVAAVSAPPALVRQLNKKKL